MKSVLLAGLPARPAGFGSRFRLLSEEREQQVRWLRPVVVSLFEQASLFGKTATTALAALAASLSHALPRAWCQVGGAS